MIYHLSLHWAIHSTWYSERQRHISFLSDKSSKSQKASLDPSYRPLHKCCQLSNRIYIKGQNAPRENHWTRYKFKIIENLAKVSCKNVPREKRWTCYKFKIIKKLAKVSCKNIDQFVLVMFLSVHKWKQTLSTFPSLNFYKVK